MPAQNQFPVPSGNVGINFPNPPEALSVGGNIKLNGGLYWDFNARVIENFTETDGVSRLMRFRNSMYAADGILK